MSEEVQLTEPQQKALEQRRRWLGMFWAVQEAHRGTANIANAVGVLVKTIHAEGGRVGMSTLYRWDREYQDKGLRGLIDGRSGMKAPRVPGFCAVPAKLVAGCREQLAMLRALGLAHCHFNLSTQRETWRVWRPLMRRGGIYSPQKLADSVATWILAPFARELGAAIVRSAAALEDKSKE